MYRQSGSRYAVFELNSGKRVKLLVNDRIRLAFRMGDEGMLRYHASMFKSLE